MGGFVSIKQPNLLLIHSLLPSSKGTILIYKAMLSLPKFKKIKNCNAIELKLNCLLVV
jgi:hypothetical protein